MAEKLPQQTLVSELTSRNTSVLEVKYNRKFSKLSIIIPAYNEEKTIRLTIDTVKRIVTSFDLKYEIIVINDGSYDLTKEEAERSGVQVISLRDNAGKANALRIGFKVSSGMNLLTIDADGSHQKEDIKALIETYYNNRVDHMVIGSRFLNKHLRRFTSPMNIVGNKIFKHVLFLISGVYITDPMSGLRIFDRRILRSIDLISKGYEIESEISAKLIGLGYKVSEISINCKPRIYGKSNLNSILDGIKILKTIILSYFWGRRVSHNSMLKRN